MSLLDEIRAKAKTQIKTIVFPEGNEPRTVQAAAILKAEGLAEPILVGAPEKVCAAAEENGAEISGIRIVDPAESPDRPRYRNALYEIRKTKGISRRMRTDWFRIRCISAS